MKLRTAAALILTAAVLAGGGAWAAEGWFPDVPDDHRRIDAIRYAKTEGLFQGFPDGNMRPDDELSEGQFIKVAERLYDRYDVWTRADWAQVMYGGLPSLSGSPPPPPPAPPAATVPPVPAGGSCGWPLGAAERITAAPSPPAQIRFLVTPCSPPVTYRIEFNGGQTLNLPFPTSAARYTTPLAWFAELTMGTVRVTEYRPGGPADGELLGETKIPWQSVASRPPAPTTTTTTTTTTTLPAPTTTTTRPPTVTIPPLPVPEVPYDQRDVIVHYFGHRAEPGDFSFVSIYVADPDGPIPLDMPYANLFFRLEVFTSSEVGERREDTGFSLYGSSSSTAAFPIRTWRVPSDWESIRLRLSEPKIQNGREVPPHPFRSVTFVEAQPPAAECVAAFLNPWSSSTSGLRKTWSLRYRPECRPSEWDAWWGVRANAPAAE